MWGVKCKKKRGGTFQEDCRTILRSEEPLRQDAAVVLLCFAMLNVCTAGRN